MVQNGPADAQFETTVRNTTFVIQLGAKVQSAPTRGHPLKEIFAHSSKLCKEIDKNVFPCTRNGRLLIPPKLFLGLTPKDIYFSLKKNITCVFAKVLTKVVLATRFQERSGDFNTTFPFHN